MRNMLCPLVLVSLVFWPHAQTRSQPAPAAALTLLSLEPKEQSEVDSSTVLKARLEYQLPDGKGTYFVLAMFDTTTPNISFDGSFPSKKYPKLKSPSGKLTYEFPMKHVLQDNRLAEPIRVRFLLNVRTGAETSRAIVATQVYEFRGRPKR